VSGSSNSPASDSGVTSSSTPLQLLGVGVGVGVTAPSCEQVALLPGWVHIRFSHSWFTAVSNPLAEPLFLHSSMVTVLPLPYLYHHHYHFHYYLVFGYLALIS
jgi:hypothetical protein